MIKNDIPLWQTPEWEQFQQALGHQTLRFGDTLMMFYPLPLGMKYGYIPRGPLSLADEELHDQLKNIARKKGLTFTRIEPHKDWTHLEGANITPALSYRQPQTTLLVDLELSKEKILAQMKRKGRYNIGLAQKKGVTVKKAKGSEEKQRYVHIFHQLLRETHQRDQFAIHDENYYQSFLKTIPQSEIYVAFLEETPLAAGIFTFQQHEAMYYYGASSNSHREYMAPYLLQWSAITDAKQQGCKHFNFLGIAPEDAPEHHPWRGITSFKQKFGGEVLQYPEPIDIIHRPIQYKLYQLLKFFQKMIKK